MMEFLRINQLNIMLSLLSIALIIAFLVVISEAIPKRRKLILIIMELGAALLLEADRISYIYQGYPGVKGYYLVRIGNFLVFFMTVFILFAVNRYIMDALSTDGGLTILPTSLHIADYLALASMVLVVIAHFTGLYYTFNSNNEYQRAPLYLISYIFPYAILMLLFYAIIRYGKLLRKSIARSLFLFCVVCVAASVIQFFAVGVSVTDMLVTVMVINIYIFSYIDFNEKLEEANRLKIDSLMEEQKSMKKLFEQTSTAIVSSIDAKDRYTQGHSLRVAEYARKIAKESGKSEAECEEVYYAGLLHDVGKIGIADDIIKKDSSLTDQENEVIHEHSVIGREILSIITDFPYLSVAAAYHHERYDGSGYPEGLRGKEIPEIARIIAVADTYDAMTSKRMYRDPLPQQTVKEEIIKGAGTQFDPEYADIMVRLINEDTEYNMREQIEDEDLREDLDLQSVPEIRFDVYKDRVSDGILLSSKALKIRFKSVVEEGFDPKISIPSLVIFDSNDGCAHRDERSIKNLHYLEYAEVWSDGHTVTTAARNIRTFDGVKKEAKDIETSYDIEVVRFKDHARVRIDCDLFKGDIVIALPDRSRFAYVGVTGEHCRIYDIEVENAEEEISEGEITRIAEEISYTRGPEGDLKNLEVDGYRSDSTVGVSVINGMTLSFHAKSLPTANLVWHCPFINLFYSENAEVHGPGYREYALIRLDGGDGTDRGMAENHITAEKGSGFKGWDEWKESFKKGLDCTVTLRRKRNTVTLITENNGISIKSITSVKNSPGDIFVALTGDQCAITDIRIG